MKNLVLKLIVAVGLAASAGCMKNTTLVTVNPDGSGTITVSDSFSPQVSGMLSGMGGAMEGIMESMGEAMGGAVQGMAEAGGETGGAAESVAFTMPEVDFGEMMKSAAENRTAKLGPGVELVGSTVSESENGWKGYKATYKFADINLVRVGVGGIDLTEAGMSKAEEEPVGFTFKFVPGDPSRLEIIPAGKTEESSEATATPEDADIGKAGDAMGAGMAQMMAPMLSGLRLSLLVRVNGEVVETNSDYKSETHPNVITLLDMPVEKMVGNPKAMAILSSEDPETFAKLRALNLPGVKLEDETKTIFVLFK